MRLGSIKSDITWFCRDDERKVVVVEEVEEEVEEEVVGEVVGVELVLVLVLVLEADIFLFQEEMVY
jgi:hypothetical protein